MESEVQGSYQVIITGCIGYKERAREMSQPQRIRRQVYQCALPLWKKALWSIISICFVSILGTMWHNTDNDGDASASGERKHKHLNKICSWKSFQSEKALGTKCANRVQIHTIIFNSNHQVSSSLLIKRHVVTAVWLILLLVPGHIRMCEVELSHSTDEWVWKLQ